MKQIDKNTLERLRWRFPADLEVELVRMDDEQAPPLGTRGKVMFVDDNGTVHVNWDTGSSLGAVFEVDKILPVCPICHKAYSEYPALSRTDNETLICSECGMREAMNIVGFKKEFQEEVIAETKKKEPNKQKIHISEHAMNALVQAIYADLRKMDEEGKLNEKGLNGSE